MEYSFLCISQNAFSFISVSCIDCVYCQSNHKIQARHNDECLFDDSIFTLVLLCSNFKYKFDNIELIMDDVVVVGGGIIGAATAYFLSKEGRKVKVIERDPTYKTASFPLSLGGFRRQFFQKENILLGKFAREFIFQIPELLKTEKNPNPTASMVTNGYLLMFGPEHAEEQYSCLLYTSPSPRDGLLSRMPSSA